MKFKQKRPPWWFVATIWTGVASAAALLVVVAGLAVE